MDETAGTLNNGNDAIAYRLRRSEGGCLAVSLHGGGPTSMRTVEYLSPLLESLSIGLLRFDFPGQGESPGSMRESSLRKRYEQARFVIDALAPRDELCLIGTSMGGYIASKLAAAYPAKKLVLFCPAAYDVAAWDLAFDSGFTRAIRREGSYLDSDVGTALGSFSGDALLFIGDRDEVIPKEVVGLYERALGGCRSFRKVVLAGAPHPLHAHAAANPEAELIIKAELGGFLSSR